MNSGEIHLEKYHHVNVKLSCIADPKVKIIIGSDMRASHLPSFFEGASVFTFFIE